MTPKRANMLKTVNQSALIDRKTDIEKQFNAKRDEFLQKEQEWRQFSQTIQSELVKLQGAYEAINILISEIKQ